jgi:hypothetical protein
MLRTLETCIEMEFVKTPIEITVVSYLYVNISVNFLFFIF